jgi:hypothetical protein
MRPTPGCVIKSPFVVEVTIQSGVIIIPTIITCNHALSSLRPIASKIVKVPREKMVGFSRKGRIHISEKNFCEKSREVAVDEVSRTETKQNDCRH